MENQNPEEEARVEQMIDELMRKAKIASQEYMKLDQETVDNITKAMSMAGLEHHMELAKMAVEETGRGIYEDKITKNMFATEYVYHSIKHEKTVGIIKENDEDGYVEIAEPVGIIAGVTPVTNPTSTTMFKSIIAAKTRNVIVLVILLELVLVFIILRKRLIYLLMFLKIVRIYGRKYCNG